jgi:holin-like protein
MKWMKQFLLLMILTCVGELLRYLIPLAVPAGIYGMVLLFLFLCTGVIQISQVDKAADFLIEIMPLFFIPAGVGLMTKWAELKTMLVPFLLAVIVITVLVMAVTGLVSQALLRHRKERDDE